MGDKLSRSERAVETQPARAAVTPFRANDERQHGLAALRLIASATKNLLLKPAALRRHPRAPRVRSVARVGHVDRCLERHAGVE